MASFYRRYVNGEHEATWAELHALGAVPTPLAEDVAAVATETMRRASAHVARLAAILPELGFVPEGTTPLHRPATVEDHATVDTLAAETGGLPAALAACLREVGLVSFLGDCPALALTYRDAFTPTAMPPGPE